MRRVTTASGSQYDLVNLTAHTIELMLADGRYFLEPDGRATVECSTVRLDDLRAERVYGDVRGLPENEPDREVPRIFIVSQVVKHRPECIDRLDVAVVGGIERGAHGEPLRARFLVV